MSDSREVLLKLVRAAMGWKCDFTLPPDIDWKSVLTMATEQGVEAIALDGYQSIKNKNPNTNLSLDSFENKPLLLEYLGRLRLAEQGNLQRLAALTELSGVLNNQKIPFMLMKGFACGQYYPIPIHRACGDIDIYTTRFEESNKALIEARIGVEQHYYRHSVSYIKGVMIENHRILADLRGPQKQSREFEALLESEVAKSFVMNRVVRIHNVDVQGAIFPTANFNALFLPWHVSAHFEFERVTIRHLLDWALFLIRDGKNFDVEMFQDAKRKYKYGFSKIANIITNLSVRYLGIPTDNVPEVIIEDAMHIDSRLADRVFDYMFTGQLRERDKNVWKFRLNNVKRIWQERWKYRKVYNISVFEMMFYKLYGVLFNVGEKD